MDRVRLARRQRVVALGGLQNRQFDLVGFLHFKILGFAGEHPTLRMMAERLYLGIACTDFVQCKRSLGVSGFGFGNNLVVVVIEEDFIIICALHRRPEQRE